MSVPAVSVVIPTRERHALLSSSLASVFAQTFVDYEVIVVDDGSATAVDCRACGDPRVRVIRHPERLGASAARNTGLAAAAGEFIAFLDDDDEWHPEKLAIQLNELHEAGPDAVLVYCGYELKMMRTGMILERFMPDQIPLTGSSFFRRTYFGCSTPLIRASLLRAAEGFDASLGGMQDRDLWLRLAAYGRFVPVPRILVVCHVHGPSISTNVHIKIQGKYDFWKKHASTLSADPVACAHHWRRLAMLHFAGGDGRNGRLCLGRAHEWAPQGWKRHLHTLGSQFFPRSHTRYIARTVFRGMDGLRWYS
jgi:glycosyltransferase involved in cell wall biosynthesis